jgi:Tfp pilus assembly protein PilO
MKINLQNRQRLLMVLAGAAVALLILDRVVFTPLTNTWTKHSGEIAQLQKSVAAGRGTIERGPQTRRVWTEMESGALPKDPAKAEQDLLTAFDGWGRSSGITLGSIKPQWKRGATDRYSLLECRIDATGTLSNLTRFLFEVEKSPLALRVDSVEFTSRDDSGTRLSLGLVVTGLRFAPLEVKR